MSPELMMWFVLATKMAVTALFVTAATIIAERLGATVGALVATLRDLMNRIDPALFARCFESFVAAMWP